MSKTLHLNSERENIFFTSDCHLQHENIIKYCKRPFHNKQEMDSVLIKNWNSVVKEDDIIFVLGDFCFGSTKSWKYLTESLNGKKFLVYGNHDKNVSGNWERKENIINLLIKDSEIKDGQRITLCHYPMLSWYQSHKGAWQLYGHVHGGLSNKNDIRVTPNQLDVGVDVHNFTPISYQEVKTIITKQNLNER